MSLDAARRVLEIEADSVRRQIDNLGPGFVAAQQAIETTRGRLCLTGIGKSGLIAEKIAATLASTGTPAYFLHAGEASHGDLGMLMPGDVVLALSSSGETPEVVRLLEFARRREIRTIAMTGVPESSVARAAEITISVAIPKEACPLNLAPTASTTAMLAMGDALAMSLSTQRGFRPEDFALLHPAGSLGRRFLKVRDLMRTGDRVPTVGSAAPMTEALHEMSRKMMGVTAVVDASGRLEGVISDGDLRRLLERDPGELRKTAGDCCRKGARTIGADEFASGALDTMRSNRITSLFIVGAGGSLEGALHMHDLLSAGIG
ncbi:MAG TPA: KpsF/GutQ family sugar-phosphate isomerase [Thermoanaerobaculia bacterium]|nr:KpsF/GutQ family sugar-phosphate isomerase [Thermoanaerobaculia bacterium]